MDILPTVLALLGLPLDPAFAGSPQEWCFDDGIRDGSTGIPAVSYSRLSPVARQPLPRLPESEQRAVEDKLRALGYIETTPEGEDLVEARRLNNLGTSLLESGRVAEAERAYRDAIAAAPGYAAPRYNLMLMIFGRGGYDEAEGLFWSASERGLRERERAVIDFALAYVEKGEPARAVAVLEEGRRRYPDSYVVTLNSGTVFANLGDFEASAGAFRRALEIDGSSVAARNNLALILLRASGELQNEAEGRRLLQESLALDPNQPEIREFLDRSGRP